MTVDSQQTAVADTDLLALLTEHKTLIKAPHKELAWLVAHGRVIRFDVGDVVSRTTEVMRNLYVLLSGHIAIFVDRGGGRRKVMEWRGGDVTGLLPYSRMISPPGDTLVVEPVEALAVDRDCFPELTRECPEVTAILVHLMLDRARAFTSSDLHDEKMVSLGKLAAGLAHELNNPASAAARSAKLLAGGLTTDEDASRALGALQLTDLELAAVDKFREICLAAPATSVRSPIEQADREDEFAEWIERHGADTSAAAPLAETSVTLAALDDLAQALRHDALDQALRWIAAGSATRTLASDIEKATSRIHQLVSAVKKFTYMDRPSVPEPVEVAQGLADTVTVLASKARMKSVSVAVEMQPDLPRVNGFGGELNQVWANLIDNALDAVAESGHVTVAAAREGGWVIVRVVDDGPGIAPEILGRIFDPFFTTKPPGHGTGLGLDIARRIVRRHTGEIEVQSRPGRTEFRVSLPVAD